MKRYVPVSCFDRAEAGVVSPRMALKLAAMEDVGNQEKDILFVYRHPDGAVTLYSDTDWALERGMKLEDLHEVAIPRKLYAEGTIQDVREYVARYLEEHDAPRP